MEEIIKRRPRLTANERALLVRLIDIVEASEWDSGDLCLTQRQFDALQRARVKLSAPDQPRKE